jgi:hypothetical protein
VIAWVVAPPGDQVFPVVAFEVSMTLPPAQKVNGPEAVTLGAVGVGLTVTTVGAEGAEVQPAVVTWTV